jgi:ABC-2 type transport system ATP-binding protein
MSIEIRDITKLFGKQKALDHVSFSVWNGQLVGFLGPNGAGKSTLMKIITGFIAPSSGEVLVNKVRISPDHIQIRRDIGYLPENNPLYADLYVKEYLEIIAGFYRLTGKKKRVAEMVEITGLRDEQNKKIGALSKGYRQRVGLAQALIHNPAVLILDEPTSGLDPNQLEEIRKLIKDISREKTVMLSSHIMQEVEAVCNRIVIINKGEIVADAGVDELKSGKLRNKQQVVAEFLENITGEKLNKIKGVTKVVQSGNQFLLEPESDIDIRPEIFRFAVNENLTLIALQEKQQNLETIFHELTQNSN